MSSTGLSYLDAIFSAMRDASQFLAEGEAWLDRADGLAENSQGDGSWEMLLLRAARDAHVLCRTRLDVLERELFELSPSGRLPVLLDMLPSRLLSLRESLSASEDRLHRRALAFSSRAKDVGSPS